MNRNKNNRVIIFSDFNILSAALLEHLLSNNFIVTICTNEVSEWKNKTQNIKIIKNFKIVGNIKDEDSSNFNYSICVYGFNDNYQKFKIISQLRTIVLIPFEKFDLLSKNVPLQENVSILYVGDLIGPRLNLKGNLLIEKLISNIYFHREMECAVGELYYPIFIKDVVFEIFKNLFSFGLYGKSMLLLGEQTNSRQLWELNRHFYPDLKLRINTNLKSRKLPSEIVKKNVFSNLKHSFSLTYDWLNLKKEITFGKYKKRVINIRNLIVFLFIFFLFPLINFAVAVFIYYLSYHSYSTEKILLAKPFLYISKESSRFVSSFPLVGKYYKELQFASDIGISLGKISVDAYPVGNKLIKLSGKIFQNESYDVKYYLEDLDSELARIDVESDLLFRKINSDYYKNLYINNWLTSRYDLFSIKKLISQHKNFTTSIEDILGVSSPKTYLILFQNNMELRPTGGFIGSYGLTTFEKGRLTDMTVSDVYSADGQLKGHVEPPQPIRDYLNEANWYLRDSNWDPNFPISAKRAEWFLDKEIGKQVDGVIAIDLGPIKDILKVTGPMFLADYNMDITSDNLYEKTQEEVEHNFFAGSRKKASFLTSLSRNLLSTFDKSDINKRFKIVSVLYENLEKRHIQLYFDNDNTQELARELNWDGSVKESVCGNDCYGDIVGLVEANLGVNKVNQFIRREVFLDIWFDESYVYRKVTLKLVNSANPSLGVSGRYKVFVDLLQKKDSYPLIDGELIEVLPKSEKQVEFNWKSNLPENFNLSNYHLYYRKQAGISEFPFSLTINGKNEYNSTTDKDFYY